MFSTPEVGTEVWFHSIHNCIIVTTGIHFHDYWDIDYRQTFIMSPGNFAPY